MSDQTNDNQASDPTRGESCSPSSGCPSCGGGKFMLLIFAGLVVAYLLANRPGPAAPSAVKWVPNHDQALAMAAESNKPVLLAFKASWCGPCRTMDSEVFAKDAAAKALTGWVPVHVDVDEEKQVARKYDISGVPTFIALSPEGKEIARTTGGLSLSQFAQFLASAESQVSSPTARAN